MNLFKHNNALLRVSVGVDVEHGAAVSWDDSVLHYGIRPHVQIVSFNLPH